MSEADIDIAKAVRVLNHEKSQAKFHKKCAAVQFSLPLPLIVGWYAGIDYCIESLGGPSGPIAAWIIVFLFMATIFVVANIFGGVMLIENSRDKVFKANEEYLALMDRYGASLGS